MAQDQANQPGSDYVGVTRVIEYYGPAEWIQKVLDNSRIPISGTKAFAVPGDGPPATIRGGMVVWQTEEPATEQPPSNGRIVGPDGATIPFPVRPGGKG